MLKKIAVIVICFAMVSAHAGWFKKALVIGGITYAGHSVAKKIKSDKEKKAQEDSQNHKNSSYMYNNVQPVDKEVQK